MDRLNIRHYLLVAVIGVLHASAVSAHVGVTKTGWNDLAPEVRAEIAALKATVAKLQAGQVGTTKTGWNNLANDVQDWLIDQIANVGALRTEVTTNGTAISGHTASIATNVIDIDGLEVSNVANLSTYLRIGTHNGKPAVIFEDANVLVWNGSGSTAGPTDGVGNLIVGYDEPSTRPAPADDTTGSHNLVVGSYHAYSSYGGLVAGYNNNVTGIYASVSGGTRNTASAYYSSVSGGSSNTASGHISTVSSGHST